MSSFLISMYACDHPGCDQCTPGNGLYDPPDGWWVEDTGADHSPCYCPEHAPYDE
nr:MAG TPA: Herpesvirus UL16/UL94 family [Caudoviricetes sp.]